MISMPYVKMMCIGSVLLKSCMGIFKSSTMKNIEQAKETTVVDLGALLDDGDDAVVILVAGNTHLVAHRAVLMDRSPVFAAMFAHDMLESRSSQVIIVDVDVEGPVLRQLLAYLYTLQAPQLPDIDMVTQLLAAADMYRVAGLKAACEQQVAAQLSVETAAAAAVLAVRHSCESLREASITFLKANLVHMLGTQGWADTELSQPQNLAEESRLEADPLPESSAPAPAHSGASHQPHSGGSRHSGTPASAAPATPPPDDAAVSLLRSLSAEEKSRRLSEAAEEGAVEELEALVAAGADVAPSLSCKYGITTPLHCAAIKGHVEAVRRLVAWGAPVDATDQFQQTPLHFAAGCGHAAVVRLLLAASADHRARTVAGWEPLHWAAYGGNTEAAAAILEAGAPKWARSNMGVTALDLARQQNHHHLVELLAET